MRLDTTGPACFRQATTATRDPGRRRPQAAAAAEQRGPAPSPVAEARRRPCSWSSVPLKRGRHPPTQRVRSDSDPCTVVNIHPRRPPAQPAAHHRTAPPNESFL